MLVSWEPAANDAEFRAMQLKKALVAILVTEAGMITAPPTTFPHPNALTCSKPCARNTATNKRNARKCILCVCVLRTPGFRWASVLCLLYTPSVWINTNVTYKVYLSMLSLNMLCCGRFRIDFEKTMVLTITGNSKRCKAYRISCKRICYLLAVTLYTCVLVPLCNCLSVY